MQKIKIGVMGLGFVGGAFARYYQQRDYAFGETLFGFDPGRGFNDIALLNREAEIVFICVPTPYRKDGVGHDLSYVRSAFAALTGSKTVVIRSTVLPGTTAAMAEEFPQHRVLFNPEFLTEESSDQTMANPDKQVIGYTSEASKAVADDVLRFLPPSPYTAVMTATGAEMVKYVNNTYLSLIVTFANQVDFLCQKVGADYDAVKKAVLADRRIGKSHWDTVHNGKRGYAGKCLPKDTRALIQLGREVGFPMELLETVDRLNTALIAAQNLDEEKLNKGIGALPDLREFDKAKA